jgi:hypothetical protein
MNGQRILRLALVIISNGVLFLFAASDLLRRSEVLYWRVVAGGICAGLAAGAILEVANRKTARLLNVGIPALAGLLLATSIIWLPILAKIQRWEHPADAYEGAPFLLIYSLLPFFLAAAMEVVYRVINVSPNARQESDCP